MASRRAPELSSASVWLRLAAEVGAILVAVSLAYAGLDKRLAVIELKLTTSAEAQKDFASQGALEGLEARVQVLEQRSGK